MLNILFGLRKPPQGDKCVPGQDRKPPSKHLAPKRRESQLGAWGDGGILISGIVETERLLGLACFPPHRALGSQPWLQNPALEFPQAHD